MPDVAQISGGLFDSNPTSGTPTYSYTYDRFGNRWNQTGPQTFNATLTGNDPGSPQNNNRMWPAP